ncbi:MAG: ubiquinol-cytochrome C chaperone family protein [Pseudomonadota bacterium]
MFKFFSKQNSSASVPEQIYGTVVARARDPVFFTEFGISDTVMGRFEVLALHIFLFSRRMKREGTQIALDLSQELFDLFVADVERALRELGIGDTSVPKRKKAMIHSFYGQIEDFDLALEQNDLKLLAERASNRYLEGRCDGSETQIANYMADLADGLDEMEFETVRKGQFSWPELPELVQE